MFYTDLMVSNLTSKDAGLYSCEVIQPVTKALLGRGCSCYLTQQDIDTVWHYPQPPFIKYSQSSRRKRSKYYKSCNFTLIIFWELMKYYGDGCCNTLRDEWCGAFNCTLFLNGTFLYIFFILFRMDIIFTLNIMQ